MRFMQRAVMPVVTVGLTAKRLVPFGFLASEKLDTGLVRETFVHGGVHQVNSLHNHWDFMKSRDDLHDSSP